MGDDSPIRTGRKRVIQFCKTCIRFVQYRADIFLQASYIVCPLVIFTVILLCLIQLYQWDRREQQIDQLVIDSSYQSNFIYVAFSATKLILVASWSSSVALPLCEPSLKLLSYVVSADLIRFSRLGCTQQLPCPAQLSLLTDILDSKKWPLALWFAGIWKKQSRRFTWVVEIAVGCSLAGLALSIAIILADTWLHVDTVSVTKNFLADVDPSAAGAAFLYSRVLRDDCNGTGKSVCSVNTDGSIRSQYEIDLVIAGEDYETQINRSANGTWSLIPTIRFITGLASSDAMAEQSFNASTIGGRATCKIANNCTIEPAVGTSGNAWNFKCSQGMTGTVGSNQTVSVQPWWQPNQSYDALSSHYENSSNIEFGYAILFPNINITNPLAPSTAQVELSNTMSTVLTAQCNSSLHSATTGRPNGSESWQTEIGDLNRRATDTARAPFLAGYLDSPGTQDWANKVFERNSLVSTTPQNTSREAMLAALEELSIYFSLAMLGGTVKPSPALDLKLGNSTIVTQVGKAPLVTLVILNLWYAGFGVLLCLLALIVLGDEENAKDVAAVQQLLTTKGLIMTAVKRSRDDLSDNDHLRIGAEKSSDGTWQLRIWDSLDDNEEHQTLLAHGEERDKDSSSLDPEPAR